MMVRLQKQDEEIEVQRRQENEKKKKNRKRRKGGKEEEGKVEGPVEDITETEIKSVLNKMKKRKAPGCPPP